jgi:hypothetical protein
MKKLATYLLGSDGLTVVRRPRVEEDQKIEQIHEEWNGMRATVDAVYPATPMLMATYDDRIGDIDDG